MDTLAYFAAKSMSWTKQKSLKIVKIRHSLKFYLFVTYAQV